METQKDADSLANAAPHIDLQLRDVLKLQVAEFNIRFFVFICSCETVSFPHMITASGRDICPAVLVIKTMAIGGKQASALIISM